MWSFTRFSEYGNLRWKMFGILNRWSIMGGGHLRDVPSMVILRGKFLVFQVSGHLLEVVPYEMWSFMRCSEYSNLSWKFLLFQVGGHLWEVVPHERWSFTSGSEYSNLGGKSLEFWIGGRLWEVVPYGRWSHMEVRLYYPQQNLLEFKENIYVSVLVLGCHLCKFQSIFLRRIIS